MSVITEVKDDTILVAFTEGKTKVKNYKNEGYYVVDTNKDRITFKSGKSEKIILFNVPNQFMFRYDDGAYLPEFLTGDYDDFEHYTPLTAKLYYLNEIQNVTRYNYDSYLPEKELIEEFLLLIAFNYAKPALEESGFFEETTNEG